MQTQSGYVIFIIMIVLILGGSALLYTGLNSSALQMKIEHGNKQTQQLQLLKQRLILFAKQPAVFCTEAMDDNKKYLPTELNKNQFGFNDLGDTDLFSLNYTETPSTEVCKPGSPDLEAYPVCDFSDSHIATLGFANQTNLDDNDPNKITLKIYKTDLGCAP